MYESLWSATYQAILQDGEEIGIRKGEESGRTAEACRLLVKLGTQRLGEPDAATLAKLGAIPMVEALEELVLRVPDVETWSELLG